MSYRSLIHFGTEMVFSPITTKCDIEELSLENLLMMFGLDHCMITLSSLPSHPQNEEKQRLALRGAIGRGADCDDISGIVRCRSPMLLLTFSCTKAQKGVATDGT